MSTVPASHHVLERAIALDTLRVLYVPVPKAGSTAILWALAELAGLREAEVARSRRPEVTRALTVHDLAVWGPHALRTRSPSEVEHILAADDWFRFTIVREPVRRLWSAWVSKLLVRDPAFAAALGDEPWFPPVPRTSDDVVDSFRRFVSSLRDDPSDGQDPHWRAQTDLIDAPAVGYVHVGHMEQLEQTTDALGAHLETRGRTLSPLRRENPSLLPYTAGLLDAPALEACTRFTARDRESFGYEWPESAEGPSQDWSARVDASLPAVEAIIERNARIGDLRRMLKETESAAETARSRHLAAALSARSTTLLRRLRRVAVRRS